MGKFKADFQVVATFAFTLPVSGVEIKAKNQEQAQKLADAMAKELEGASGTPAIYSTELYGILRKCGVELANIGEYIAYSESDKLIGFECSVTHVNAKDVRVHD